MLCVRETNLVGSRVLQLPHIARPVMGREALDCIVLQFQVVFLALRGVREEILAIRRRTHVIAAIRTSGRRVPWSAELAYMLEEA